MLLKDRKQDRELQVRFDMNPTLLSSSPQMVCRKESYAGEQDRGAAPLVVPRRTVVHFCSLGGDNHGVKGSMSAHRAGKSWMPSPA